MLKSIKFFLIVATLFCLMGGGYYFLDEIFPRDISTPDTQTNNENEGKEQEHLESDVELELESNVELEPVEPVEDFSQIQEWQEQIKSELTPAQITEWQEKLAKAEKALKTDPACQKYSRNCYSFCEQIGLAKQKLGDFAGAVEAYEQAIGFDPTNYFSYISLGDIYQAVEEYQKSEEYFISAINARPEENVGYLKLGELYYEDKIPEKKDQAEEIWRLGMYKSNNHFSLMLRLADYFYEIKKLEEAEGFYQAYLNYDPDNERVREMLYKTNREK